MVKIVTCAMCRDQLAKTGKPVLHLLDILFANAARPADEPPASISVRRENRRRLKAELLARYPEAELPPRQQWEELTLDIPAPVAKLLEERRILEDDIRRVLFATRAKGLIAEDLALGQMLEVEQLLEDK